MFRLALGMADSVPRSTDFRQFEQYLNVTGVDVSWHMSDLLTSSVLIYKSDGRCWQQLYISHAPGMFVNCLRVSFVKITS
jgi:hypothetical protein